MINKKMITVLWILLIVFFIPLLCSADTYLTWGESSGVVDGYRIYYRIQTDTYNIANSRDVYKVNDYSLNNLPLQDQTQYYFIVRAYNEYGEGPDSDEISWSSDDSTPPMPPTGVRLEDVVVSWDAVEASDLQYYRVYIGTAQRDYSSSYIVDRSGNSYRFENLDQTQDYFFAATAVDTSGNESGYSAEVSKIISSEPPSAELVVTIVKPTNYTMDSLEDPVTEVVSYIDRAYYFTEVPESYLGLDVIQTSNTDKPLTTEDFLTFSVNQSVTVYVGYKQDAPSLPSWLSENFVKNGDIIKSSYTSWDVWQRDYSAGEITLGGNLTQADGSYNAMYTVIVKSRVEADTTAPVVSINSPSTGASYDTSAATVNIGGTASDNRGITEVVWSNAAGGSGTATGTDNWTAGDITLVEGGNAITVTARDAAGNEASATMTVTYTAFDTTSPSVSISNPTTAASYATTSATIDLSGAASDDRGVTLVGWSNAAGGSGTATGTDNWSVSGIALVEGSNVITVSARDAAGNESMDTITVTYTPEIPSGEFVVTIIKPSNYTIDRLEEPVTEIVTYIDRGYYFTEVPEQYLGLTVIKTSNTDKPLTTEDFLTFSVSEPVTVYVGYKQDAPSLPSWLSQNFVRNGDIIKSSYTTWDVWQRDYPAGEITLGANLTQADGSYNAMYTVLLKPMGEIDTSMPLVSINSPTTEASYDTSAAAIDLGGTASDNKGVTGIEWSNAAGGSGSATGTDSWSVGGISLVEGENVITITAMDAAENKSTDIITVIYAIPDTTKPSVSITSPTADPTFDTISSSIDISGAASDNKGVTEVFWSNSTGGSGPATGTDTWSVGGIGLVEGENVITITAMDAADNEFSDNITVIYTIPDTTVPSITISLPTTDVAFNTLNSSIDISGVASDNKGVTEVFWSNSAGGSGTATGTDTWSIADVGLVEGNNIIIVIALDAAGNESTDRIMVTYTIPDTISPSVSITSPTNDAVFTTTSSSIDVAGTASDNKAVAQVTWTNSRGGSGTAAGTTSWTLSDVELFEGENVITVTAMDEAENKSTKVLTITYIVPDTEAPTLELVAPTTGGFYFTGSDTVDLSGTASDNVGVKEVRWSNSKGGSGVASGTSNWSVSGVSIAIWWNTITITTVDDAGNETSIEVTVFSWR